MGQAEIYEHLKKNKGKPFTVKELSRKFDCRTQSISRCIKRLEAFDHNIVVIPKNRSIGRYGVQVFYKPNRSFVEAFKKRSSV